MAHLYMIRRQAPLSEGPRLKRRYILRCFLTKRAAICRKHL